jgi:hypothetical protein
MDHCCQYMNEYLAEDNIAIKYSSVVREYCIPVLDGGSSGIILRFCPWCGNKLPTSLREKWFGTLESLGYDPGPDTQRSKDS